MNANSVAAVVVEGGGEGVVAHVGLHALGSLADRLGLGPALSAQIPAGLVEHDRGKVLVQTMLMLAGGGEACSDIEHLRAQPELFGAVPSDSTLYRTIRSIDPHTLARVWEAAAGVRAQVWRRASATTGAAPVVLDLDASLVEIHSEHKQGTAATYKGGFGFAPMFCFADATGEALAAILRPGNATANSIADQLAAVDAAVAQLPAEVSVGHRPGDEASLVGRAVRVRADSAGCSPKLATALRARNVGFAVVARTNAQVQGAISRAIDAPGRWAPALTQGGEVRPGAKVAELTDLINLDHWPRGTRLIVRREPLHPGAQTSLFPDLEFRYWGHYTDAHGDPVELDVHMRAHARAEDHIRRLKASGLERLPFSNLGQPGVVGGRVPRRRPGALVPAAVPRRASRRRRTKDPALGAVAHSGPGGAPLPPAHPARARRLAHHLASARRLPPPRPHHLSLIRARSDGDCLLQRALAAHGTVERGPITLTPEPSGPRRRIRPTAAIVATRRMHWRVWSRSLRRITRAG